MGEVTSPANLPHFHAAFNDRGVKLLLDRPKIVRGVKSNACKLWSQLRSVKRACAQVRQVLFRNCNDVPRRLSERDSASAVGNRDRGDIAPEEFPAVFSNKPSTGKSGSRSCMKTSGRCLSAGWTSNAHGRFDAVTALPPMSCMSSLLDEVQRRKEAAQP